MSKYISSRITTNTNLYDVVDELPYKDKLDEILCLLHDINKRVSAPANQPIPSIIPQDSPPALPPKPLPLPPPPSFAPFEFKLHTGE